MRQMKNKTKEEKDTLGFEISGYNSATTDKERLEILKSHRQWLRHHTEEAISDIDDRIENLSK